MKKILVLELDNEYKMLRNTTNSDVYNYYKYSNNNIIQKVIKKLELSLTSIFFGNWKKKIELYDVFILFDRGFNKTVTRYIRKKNKNAKIILWLWNPVSSRQKYFMTDKNIDEIWTYDKNDSITYNINFNTQFYNKEFLVKTKKTNNYKYDIMFIGNDKGRKEIIEKYTTIFLNYNLKTYIKIIERLSDNIKYDNYLNYLSETKVVFEIVKEDVSGLTLRALEALFFEKKLITNNRFIENYDFYNPNNIFILGKDDINSLEEFINSDYLEIDKKIVDYYEYQQWLNRFI